MIVSFSIRHDGRVKTSLRCCAERLIHYRKTEMIRASSEFSDFLNWSTNCVSSYTTVLLFGNSVLWTQIQGRVVVGSVIARIRSVI